MSRRGEWQEIHRRFDPFKPALPGWRADRPRSPARQVIDDFKLPFADPRVLITGTVGAGKSTELLRIREGLRATNTVVLLDLHTHFSSVVGDKAALEKVTSWEVVFLATLALVHTAQGLLPHPIPASHLEELVSAWEKLADKTETPRVNVDIAALTTSMAKGMALAADLAGAGGAATGALNVAGAVASAIKGWVLPLGRSTRSLPDQDESVQSLLAAANVVIGYVQQYSQRVVMILDGLDRIRDTEHARKLVIESELIARLACPVVICGPFALRHDKALASARGYEIRPLVNEPVLDQHDPSKPGDGVGFFCDVLDKRTADIRPSLLNRQQLERLAYYSGGRGRDFIRLIRMVAKQAYIQDIEQASDAVVADALREMRGLLETGLDRGDIAVLEDIAADPKHRLAQGPIARELLSYGHLLPYPNDSEWYYPHPLLTISLVRTPGSTK